MNYLALGDSISIDDYTGVARGGAASQFARLVGADAPPHAFQNLTRDGRTTQGVLDAWAEIAAAPDVVTLTAGGNDFLLGAWQVVSMGNGWSPVSAQALANLEEIAGHLIKFGCPVVINTIYDPTDGDDSLLGAFGLGSEAAGAARTAFNALNDGIRELAARKGFLLADLETLFHGHGAAAPETWIVGQIEPNLAGATAIAQHWHGLFTAWEGMSDRERVEHRYNLRLPKDYLSMQARGWFDVKSPDYFWLHDAEWMSLTKISTYGFQYYHKPGYAPFAHTVSGDHWCWWPSENPEAVVLCPHDEYEGRFYAPTFLGFIYRQLLEHALYLPDIEEQDVRRNLRDSAARLSDYFPAAWRETLEALASAQPVQLFAPNGREAGQGLMTEAQYQEIVQRDLAFPRLDEEFLWMNPDAA